MALKQRKDGSWHIASDKDLQAVVEAIAERAEMRAEAERIMEEEYDYKTLGQEIDGLKEAMRDFMADNDIAQAPGEGGRWQLVRRVKTSWNEDKLKKALGKSKWLKVTKMVLDPDKIDDLVRKGEIKRKDIARALEQKPEKPHVRWYDSSDEAAADEEAALKKAMQ